MSCLPIATQAEAEAGTANDKMMTPLRTKEAIDALGVSQAVLESSAGGEMVGFEQIGTGAILRTQAAKSREIVSIDDFGADPTGVANSISALLLAIDACPTGGTLYFPGTYRFTAAAGTTAIVIDKTMTLAGPGHRSGNVANGNLARGFLYFDTNVGVAIQINDAMVTIDGLTISGIGFDTSTGDGIYCHGVGSALHLVGGSIVQSFEVGVRLVDGDYSKLDRSSIVYCGAASLVADSVYNLDISGCSIRPEGAASEGIIAFSNTQLNIEGGAIESFQQFGIRLNSGARAKLNGVYFEGRVFEEEEETDPTAWNIFVGDHCAVYERASLVYMTGCARHISVEGSGTVGFSIDSKFCIFIPEDDPRRVDYYSFKQAEPTGYADIEGHRFVSTEVPGANNNWLNPDFLGGYPTFAQGVGYYHVMPVLGVAAYNQQHDTRIPLVDPATAVPGAPTTQMLAAFKASGSGDDPIGIRSAYGPNAPYRAIYQNGQWEKVGLRMADQANSEAASVGALVTDFNALLAKLRAAGVMV